MKEKAITLIALVITIIVLLILAGTAIATLTGENGIIAKANTARTNIEKASAEEQVKIAVYGSYDKNGKLNLDKLKTELEKIKGNGTIIDNNGSFPVLITVDGYTFEIDGKGNITSDDENQGGGETPKPPVEKTEVTAGDIAKASDKSEIYGATVTGYTCENSTGVNAWKIFYADENNIYLIADDYIVYNYAPKGKGGSSLNQGSKDYKLYFTDILSDYAGSSDITNARIKLLNNDYFNIKGYTSNNNNMKAVAYMLDTNVWNVFSGECAEFAVGGPSLEMVLKSYSQKYNVDYRAQASSNVGYQISKDGGANWENSAYQILNTSDSLYTADHGEVVGQWWLSSPGYDSTNHVLYISKGSIGHGYTNSYDNIHGAFRPLVCLKSNVQLEKKSDGTYEIK